MSANMGGASFDFLAFSAVAVCLYNASKALLWRQAVLLMASLAFLSFFVSSPPALIPFALFLTSGFAALRAIQDGRGRVAFAPILISAIAAFVWLKKYTFLPAPLFLRFPYLTLGLSYVFFRVLHLLIDAKDGALAGRVSLVSYLNYTLNFTTLLSGPIQRYQDFAAMQLAERPLPLDIFAAGRAFERIVAGFFKVNVLSLLFSTLQGRFIAEAGAPNPLPERAVSAAVICGIYPLYLYANFSGYIDIVIGVARFLRLELPENFERPFSSDNFLNFWSRWHITLSQWLKTYVYNPLLIGSMRRNSDPKAEPFFGVFAFFVTFFLVGVWHGQTSEFLFFGVLQGGGVSAVKLYQILTAKRLGRKRYKALAANPLYNTAARGLTFAWFAFTLLWFWSSWRQLGAISHGLGAEAIALGLLALFATAAVILEIWERARGLLLSWRWRESPILTTRYARTIYGTAMAVIAIAVVLLLNAPAPDIVYKAF